jgi:hypothetical protein
MAFATKISEKRKSISPSAIQEKNRRKAISTEEKLGVISRNVKGEWTDIYTCGKMKQMHQDARDFDEKECSVIN